MQYRTTYSEEPSGAPFLWWDGDRWTVVAPARPRAGTARQPVNGSVQRHGERANGQAASAPSHFARPVDRAQRSAADNRQASLVTLALSALFALSLVMLLAGYGLDLIAFRICGVLGAFFFGIGAAPLKAFQETGLAVRLAVAILVGISLPALLASVMALGHWWHPWIIAFLLGTAVAIAHVRACRAALAWLRPPLRRRAALIDQASWLNVSTGLTAAGTFWWLVSMLVAGHIDPGVGGFLTQISAMWYVGLLLVLGGIVLARGRGELAAIAGVASLVAAMTLTPAYVYGLPRIESAGKHVGFVQQVLAAGFLDRHLGIYQAYSGFFSLAAWISDLAGARDSMGLATYWPCVIDLVGLAVLRLFFGVLLRSTYRIYTAMALTFLVDVVGQDYFSPQSAGFVLAFGVYALAIGGESVKLSFRARVSLIALISCALAIIHQLSPYAAAVVLGIFVIAKIVRPVYIPLIAAGPAILWALLNWSVLGHFISLSDLGNLSNFTPPKTVATPGLHRLPIVGQGSDALLVGLLVLICLAAVGFLAAITRRPGWGFFSRSHAWAMLISAGSGLVLIAANPYGNEGIFRAALFAIPWLAALAVTAVPKATGEWATFPFAMLLTGLTATFCLGSFGLDSAGVIRSGDIKALDFYKSKASAGSFILDLSYGNIPVGLVMADTSHYVNWTKVVPQFGGHAAPLGADSATTLAQNYLGYAYKGHGRVGQLYALWSPSSVNHAVDYGLETAGTALGWVTALSHNPVWKLVYSSNGTYLFQLVTD
jgi:hypothetical protein